MERKTVPKKAPFFDSFFWRSKKMNAQQGNYEVVSIIKREIRLRKVVSINLRKGSTLVPLGNYCIIGVFCIMIRRCLG